MDHDPSHAGRGSGSVDAWTICRGGTARPSGSNPRPPQEPSPSHSNLPNAQGKQSSGQVSRPYGLGHIKPYNRSQAMGDGVPPQRRNHGDNKIE
jgi:hypothetical protein